MNPDVERFEEELQRKFFGGGFLYQNRIGAEFGRSYGFREGVEKAAEIAQSETGSKLLGNIIREGLLKAGNDSKTA